MVSFAAAARQADSERLPVVEGITVRMKAGAGGRATTDVRASVALQLGGAWAVRRRGGGWIDLIPIDPAEPPPPLGRAWDAARALARMPPVAAAEPLLLMRVPGSDAQEVNARLGIWGLPYDRETAARLTEASRRPAWAREQLKVPQAWERWRARHGSAVQPGHGIRVAHPDTGYTLHPQISSLLDGKGKNFVEADRPRDAQDDLTTGPLRFPGHGTGTASVLASLAEEVAPSVNVSGVAPGARVRPLRISNSVIHLSFQNLVLALEEAIASDAHVVSMSLGGPHAPEALRDVVQRALDAGIIVVAAAGNYLPTVVFPAALPGVIACAASNALGMAWRFSGFGDEVAITAPGEQIWRASAGLDRDGETVFGAAPGDGTSHATAGVAGLAALWLSFHGRAALVARYSAPLLPFAFQLHLRQTADASPDFVDGGHGGFGAGIADAERLMAEPPAPSEVEAFRRELLGRDDGNLFERALRDLGRLFRVPNRASRAGPRLAQSKPLAPGTPDPDSVRRLVRELLGGELGREPDDAAMVRELAALIAGDPVLHRTALGTAQRLDAASGEARAGAAASDRELAGRTGARVLIVLRERLLAQPLSQTLRERLTAAQAAQKAGSPPAVPVEQVVRRYAPAPPPVRRLRAYAFDPSFATRLETAMVNEVTIAVPFEECLGCGPVGEYLEVVDVDPATGCAYPPVDLNHPALLAQDGLPRSEGNPQFHQQMVYAVAMRTIHHFEEALGRPIFWSPLRPWRGGDEAAWAEQRTWPDGSPDERDQFVRRLRLYPHALREANAYYNPAKRAILFGYFPARPDDPGEQYPEGIVFTCLSHDIIAHEMTHAVLDGMHVYFTEPSNPDVFAFHEAFADIVALFQHFTYPEVLRSQIARTRGDLTSENLLGQLARELGRATGEHHALRDAIGAGPRRADQAERREAVGPAGGGGAPSQPEQPEWRRYQPDPFLLPTVEEAHERGGILVAAVFDAFLNLYRGRVADLERIATGGSGVLAAGQLHPDLVNRMADEAAKAAGHVLNMCIRAMDYLPPVDITFGEFLRALITADYDLVPDDDRLYRVAFIEAFRKWGIYPRDVRTLSEESLRWHRPERLGLFAEAPPDGGGESAVTELQLLLRRAVLEWKPGADRCAIFDHLRDAQAKLHDYLQDAARGRRGRGGRAWARELMQGVDLSEHFGVDNLRPARRIGPDGQSLTEIVFEIVQPARDPEPADAGGLPLRGGVTVIVSPDDWRVRYVIYRRRLDRDGAINESRRLRQEKHTRQRAAAFGAAEYRCVDAPAPDARSVDREAMRASSCQCRADKQKGGDPSLTQPFALLHRGRE